MQVNPLESVYREIFFHGDSNTRQPGRTLHLPED